MKKNAAQLTVYALEQLGITHTFGIPGVHNTELYDELALSKKIEPILVINEQSGAFLAEAVSRVSHNGNIGVLVTVPAAGLTHAASAIGEAFLAGIPLLVITGGVRRDTSFRFKLHDVNQQRLLQEITKKGFLVERMQDVVPTLYQAYQLATQGLPGPVLVEIPVNLQLFATEIQSVPTYQQFCRQQPVSANPPIAPEVLQQIIEALLNTQQVAIFAGWGARHASAELQTLCELLQAPIATTLQGLSVVPYDFKWHTGFGFSQAAVPAAHNAFKKATAVLTVGARYSEIASGSFAVNMPPLHIQIDIDAAALGANYAAQFCIQGDAKEVLQALIQRLNADNSQRLPAARPALWQAIAKDKRHYRRRWQRHLSHGRVPALAFFDCLYEILPGNAITVLDDGNHTFLTAELFRVRVGGQVIGPTDYNAMGYAVPGAIGAKLMHPERTVFAIVGDGCFAMTCMEIATASARHLGVIFFVFNDGRLAQISQPQQTTYQKMTCTQLSALDFAGVAQATGAAYVPIQNEQELYVRVQSAKWLAAQGRAVIVDVAIDYSKKTAFTKGITMSNFVSFPRDQKLRFIKRVLKRKLFGT
ncbi:thiamine pyrophosphate-binding protein [Brackiella oedipodis]|uniref:thiamine pyrophosphate-binding protein n=1 Tax=Brackiella oedipodis TaxID=124225 RepID=UPI00049117C5|nr:thiamine pyrophosphate-binding protein [Brackiella oedipodis]